MTPSLTTLRDAIERLDLLVGLYAAPMLIERLHDTDDDQERALIVALTKVWAEVTSAARVAFGQVVEVDGPELRGAIVIPGRVEREIAALVEREKRWSEMAGFVRGRSEEVAARMSEVCGGRGPRAARPERVVVEPHRKMW